MYRGRAPAPHRHRRGAAATLKPAARKAEANDVLDALAGIATLAFIASGFAVGLRLLALARRTRGVPETTLGLGLFLIVGVGFPVALAGRAIVEPAPEAARLLLSLAPLLLNAGWIGVWVFTWRVFRAGSRAARTATGLAIVALIALAGASATRNFFVPADRIAGPSIPGTATQLLALGVYVWTTVEALRQHAMQRRRLVLGLGDPVVANRFLLWALVGIFSFASLVGTTVANILGVDANGVPALRLALSAAGLACAATLYLAFRPPAAYVAWVRTSAARPAASGAA